MENKSDDKPKREYDTTGFYPPEGKAFRVWALLAWLVGVIAALAVAAAVINIMVLGY